MLWAEWLPEEVPEPVDHVHWVFTVPKGLRLFFLHDRKLLGDLARCAWRTVRDLYGAGLADRRAAPGLVASIQTWGDLANWRPHIHALATASVVDRGKLDEDTAEGLLTWKHSGFSVHNRREASRR